jgi:hypothetical protein
MAETSTSAGGRWAISRRRANGARGLSGAVSFAELVRAHDRWEKQVVTGAADPPADGKDDYHERLQRFERVEGKILGAYWCTTAASAVALTVKESAGHLQPFRHSLTRIHRLSDWVIPRNGEPIAELLHHCDTLAIKASSVLTGTPARIVMQWIFAIESDLLGFIERSGGVLEKKDVEAFYNRVKKELLHVERYYDDAGNKSARLYFFFGMLAGVVLLTALGALLGGLFSLFGVLDGDAIARRTFFICFAAGGVGAVVSVLTRMGSGGKFRLDYEIGRTNAVILGSFRPFLGAIFGVVLYALLMSKIFQITPPTGPQAYYFYGTLAFLAGFNERWTHVILTQAERTIGATLSDEDNTASSKQAEQGPATSS